MLLKTWNKEEFGTTKERKEDALSAIERLDEKEKVTLLTSIELQERTTVKESYSLKKTHHFFTSWQILTIGTYYGSNLEITGYKKSKA